MLRLLIAALWLASEPGLISVQVSALDENGRPLPAVADAVVRALVVTGVTVVVGPEAHAACAERCVRLTLRRSDAERWRLEARGPGHAAGSEVKVPTSAGGLELARALAIQARLLLPLESREPTPPSPARPVGESLPVVGPIVTPPPAPTPAPASAPAPVDEPRPPSVAAAPPVSPSERAPEKAPELVPRELAANPAVPTPEVSPGALRPPPVSPPEPEPEPEPAPAPSASRVSFAAAATVLSGLGSGDGSGLTTYGAALSARVGIAGPLEARLGITMLDPWSARDQVGPYKAHARPMSALLQASVPPLPNLRLGAGAELVAIDVDRTGWTYETTAWTWGGLARMEYTQPFGLVSLAVGLQAGFHPNAGAGASGTYGAMSCFPRWSAGGEPRARVPPALRGSLETAKSPPSPLALRGSLETARSPPSPLALSGGREAAGVEGPD